jgi:hypothetical protein
MSKNNCFRTLTEAMEDFRGRGYNDEFTASKDGLKLEGVEQVYAPDTLTIVEHHRFEGESNPSDMAVIYAMESDDGHKGYYIDAFGAYSDPLAAEVLKHVKINEEEVTQ